MKNLPDLNDPHLILADPRELLVLRECLDRLQRYFPHVIIHTINKHNRIAMTCSNSPPKALDFLNDCGHKNVLCQLLMQDVPAGGPLQGEPEKPENAVEFPK